MSTPLTDLSAAEIQAAVATRYSRVATDPASGFTFPVGRPFAEAVGYDPAALDRLPAAASASFTGAGNPHPWVDAKQGESLLDLGCGAGLDLCLYAPLIGSTGQLHGLDFSPSMADLARANLAAIGIASASVHCASASAIPLPDASVDLVTANGIYNLTPDKDAVLREVWRVLKPGGRTIFAEIVLESELDPQARTGIEDWFRCIGGALVGQTLLDRMRDAGFVNPRILWTGRNARTGHPASRSAVIRAEKT